MNNPISSTPGKPQRDMPVTLWMDRIARSLVPLVGVIVFLLIWELLARGDVISSRLLPGAWATLTSMWQNLLYGTLGADLLATLSRTVYAFLIAMILGVPIGIALGASTQIYRSAEVLVDFFRSTPATALFPLALVIFGMGAMASIAVAAFAAWLVMVFNSASGVLQASRTRKNAAKVMGAPRWRVLKDVYFFEALPQTFVGMRMAISLCLVVIVVAEMFIGSVDGIGKRIIDAQIIYDLPLMYAAILVSGAMGYALNLIFILVERLLIHWSGR